ncbi:hypothetical protein F5J12DRAFT_786313 [Pisolithus orientalis]|uniref:uncharacterized protein n=1 Tax=Pisolithus orientalis TaxID=936130 RepID=UPI0022257478|nr:uncharacterized protein F5J12DRAFT_786313 [Pisolithus orientalis]KAI5991667.1 hypothetical protein F5J12DRAFT_786313 [Pisolithus orientalis]
MEHHSVNELKHKADFEVRAYGRDLTLLALEDECLAQMEEVSGERREREAADSEDDLSAILAASITVDTLQTDGITKEKFPGNSGMNLSENSVVTQLGLTEEQPAPASDIEWQLDQEDQIPSMDGPSSYAMQPALTSAPEAPTCFAPEYTYEYTYPPIPEVPHSYSHVQQGQCGGSTLGPYMYLPPELNYALPTLATRFMHSAAPHPTLYSIPSQHAELAQRHLWPGETTLNEAFSIPK